MNNINEKIEDFQLILQQTSPGTQRIYAHHIKNFFNFYETTLKKHDLKDLTERDVLLYLKNKNENIIKNSEAWEYGREKLNKRTVSLFLSSMTKFFKYNDLIENEKIITKLRSQYLGRVSVQMNPVKLTPEELKELTYFPIRSNRSQNLRNELMIKFLYTTGMREAELCDLTLEKLDLNKIEDKLIFIEGKGNKKRFIKFNKELLRQYKDYHKKYRSNDNNKYVFITKNNSQLKPYSVWEIIKGKADACFNGKGIRRDGKAVSPHKLRSTFASSLEGVDLQLKSELLGHSSTQTTLLYSKTSEEDLMKIKTPKIE